MPSPRPFRPLVLAVALAVTALACGVDGRQGPETHAVFAKARGLHGVPGEPPASPKIEAHEAFEWPQGQRSHAELEIEGMGILRVALYPEIAPATVEHFTKLANEGFYDGTTFHRVIPGFMIQGGDPNTRDDDPANDGQGGPGVTVRDEFSAAPFEAGVVALANRGTQDSGGGQFFVVHEDSPHLRGKYAAFGRVVDGLPKVDQVARVETDETGRWGPRHRPLEDVVIRSIRVR